VNSEDAELGNFDEKLSAEVELFFAQRWDSIWLEPPVSRAIYGTNITTSRTRFYFNFPMRDSRVCESASAITVFNRSGTTFTQANASAQKANCERTRIGKPVTIGSDVWDWRKADHRPA